MVAVLHREIGSDITRQRDLKNGIDMLHHSIPRAINERDSRVVEDHEATKSLDSFVLERHRKREWVRRGQDIPRWTIDLTTKPRKGTEAAERMAPLLLETFGK